MEQKPKDDSFLANLRHEGALEAPAAEPEDKDKAPDPSAPPADKKEEGEDGKPEDKTGDQEPEGEPEGEPKDPPADDPDKKPDDGGKKKEPPADDKDLPFHKHPRWIAQQTKLHELEEFREKVTPLLDKLGEPKKESESDDAIPEWFIELFGENKESWKKYRDYSAADRANLRKEIMAELQQQGRQATEQQAKLDKWVEDELSKVAEAQGIDLSPGTAEKPNSLRNELLKVALDYKPSDDAGNISFAKAYDILQAIKAKGQQPKVDKPNPAADKKKVADKTMGKDKADGQRKDYKTPEDLRGRGFREIGIDQ